jgi:hypothetical protein
MLPEFTESLFDTAPCTAQEEEAFAWEPSQEDREWFAAQVWEEMTSR